MSRPSGIHHSAGSRNGGMDLDEEACEPDTSAGDAVLFFGCRRPGLLAHPYTSSSPHSHHLYSDVYVCV